MSHAEILEFDPLDPAADAIFLATCAVNDASGRAELGELHTPYSPDELRGRQRTVTDRTIIFIAALWDRAVVGEAIIQLPLVDNQHMAHSWLSVAPAHRRKGVGSALVQRVEQTARAAGRRSLCVESITAIPRRTDPSYFAAKHGFSAAQINHRNDLVVPREQQAVDQLLVGVEHDVAAHEAVCSTRYELVTWWDDVPTQWLDHRADLFARMVTDAPTGDVDVTDEVWDADRVAEQGRIARAQGRRLVETAAVDTLTGRLIGVTSMLVVPPTYTTAYQGDTLVVREHRGHRLGQLLKAANLRALASTMPAVERVVTFNADDNGPMLRINQAMGFKPVGETIEWQKRLGERVSG